MDFSHINLTFYKNLERVVLYRFFGILFQNKGVFINITLDSIDSSRL